MGIQINKKLKGGILGIALGTALGVGVWHYASERAAPEIRPPPKPATSSLSVGRTPRSSKMLPKMPETSIEDFFEHETIFNWAENLCLEVNDLRSTAEILALKGDYDSAVLLAEDAEDYLSAARYAKKAGKLEKAMDLLRKAPADEFSSDALGAEMIEIGHSEEGLRLLELNDPEHAFRTAIKNGLEEEAIEIFGRWIEKEPHNLIFEDFELAKNAGYSDEYREICFAGEVSEIKLDTTFCKRELIYEEGNPEKIIAHEIGAGNYLEAALFARDKGLIVEGLDEMVREAFNSDTNITIADAEKLLKLGYPPNEVIKRSYDLIAVNSHNPLDTAFIALMAGNGEKVVEILETPLLHNSYFLDFADYARDFFGLYDLETLFLSKYLEINEVDVNNPSNPKTGYVFGIPIALGRLGYLEKAMLLCEDYDSKDRCMCVMDLLRSMLGDSDLERL